ncbi:zinc ribbon domain-containing protein YjdM [Streptomyces sp. NBC_00878]|nr:zinc ribbon domain-containing protein YjdM [Streptomyces sp. NBC_00878]
MENLPPCPKCSCEYTYEMNALVVCPECGHEWVPAEGGAEGGDTAGALGVPPAEGWARVVKDSVGNELRDGDSVVVVKALKVKGSPSGIKAGTKVRSIRLVDGVDGHDIDCRIDGFGAMQLKSSVVKKA